MMASNKENSQLTSVQDMKDSLKVPSRKLWNKKNMKMDTLDENWMKYRDANKWDMIASPQFVDFTNASDRGDSFFNKSGPIVTTPIPGIIKAAELNETDNTLIDVNRESPMTACETKKDRQKNISDIVKSPQVVEFNNSLDREPTFVSKSGPTVSTPLPNIITTEKLNDTLALSPVNRESSVSAYGNNKDRQENIKEQHEPLDMQVNPEAKPQIWDKIKKSQTAVVYPFTFDLRDKHKKEVKRQILKTVPENEKDFRVFRANPLPKYLKSRIANKENNDNNKQVINNRTEKSNKSDKTTKKTTELWKKPPFVPCSPKKNIGCPKPPVLHTAVRALQRKQFDKGLQERERQREQTREMEKAMKIRQEEDAIARLRKQTVFKAQPMPKYKMTLPKVKKRPLTDPASPVTLKRRRKLNDT
ncbi:targeting protein for Xklp2-like isoform X2 [Ceratina calcarata]|uniref:Targeting protein for Xklp2-like isoform X2 n=1 Tax=Ceratina calcarata TaxID=156304 RepID=A0AAJ7WA79_9HYME|nr:targeting protein for Xklp2-like isoform X2 [Ceratina calcarata]